MDRRVLEVRRRAAVAPDRPERTSIRLPAEVHNTCVEWARWNRTRGFFGAPMPSGSVLEQLLTVKGGGEGPNARCDPALAAFQTAINTWGTALERRIFEAHYLRERQSIKRAAAEVGISRTHWYRVVNDFARKVYAQHRNILAEHELLREQVTKNLSTPCNR